MPRSVLFYISPPPPGAIGHHQLTPVQLQHAASGSKLQPLEIPAEFLAEGITVPDQPVHELYYAYKAVFNDVKNNTQLVPDFSHGVRIHVSLR